VTEPLLSIRDLTVEFGTEDGVVHAVTGVSYDVFPGETVGVVGESGSGKSVSVMSLLGLIPQPPGRVVAGEALFSGRNLIGMKKKELRELRGGEVAMVFQDPMTSLNPVLTIGRQITEALETHKGMGRSAARKRAADLLTMVGIPGSARRIDDYPHQFSGGMRQRAMIAMALAGEPKLLIADEPTTALDVTIQAQILELLTDLQRELGMSVLLITHDLGVVAEHVHEVVVMYAGKLVERAPTEGLFREPLHPYTAGLMRSVPSYPANRGKARLATIPGTVPDVSKLPPGCRFRDRCPRAEDDCGLAHPPLFDFGQSRSAACIHVDPAALSALGLSGTP
jgi:oligopeptide/dipeptide ABC transporter ATP-binding protein